MPTVRVNIKGAGRLASGHPWVFGGDILDRGGAEPGDAVTVVDHRGKALGTAHYSSTSQISLRLLSKRVEPIDRAFLLRRIAAAEAFRKRAVANSAAYRVTHGEGDRLPGLVIDRYADYLTVQTLNQGMDRLKSDVVSCLEELFAPRGIAERNDVGVRKHESLPIISGVLAGQIPETVPIRMNGREWLANLLRGQKTGVFLDQRENYVALARYAHGDALDCFTSTGGFALHIAPHCDSVEAIDSSAPALETARLNAECNQIANVNFREADVFEVLAGYSSARRRFSTVVLDPPAFAKSRQHLDAAVRAYKEINLRALRLLPAGGILATCSCSHHVSEAMLLEIVASAALDSNRTLRVLERRTQAQDHPILLTVPETHYLKCLILEVVGT